VQLRRASALLAGAALTALPMVARADVVQLDTTHTVYHEAPLRTNMTVYTPAIDLRASPWEALDVRGGWQADVVSGASVATKAGPAYQSTHPAADVVSTASVKDLRNVGHGGFTMKKDAVALDANYAYSTENDYRSHTVDAAARTDLFEHNTQLAFAYAHNFDRVCDRSQGANDAPSRFRSLENSAGCFASSDPLRTSRGIAIDGFQGSWSQAWTPIFVTQLVYSRTASSRTRTAASSSARD
jgi:hypothetical protein